MRGADEGEVYDLVTRKGPISHRGLMTHIYSYSSDDVSTALRSLLDDDEIARREGSLEEDDTTADMYYPKEGDEYDG